MSFASIEWLSFRAPTDLYSDCTLHKGAREVAALARRTVSLRTDVDALWPQLHGDGVRDVM
jgi:hypothetical protein